MKRFLLFAMMCVCASIGTWAGTIANNNGTITLDGLSAGNLKTALTDQSVWTSGSANDLATATKVVFGSDVELNNEDLAALKTLIPAATQLNMAQVTLDAGADIANLETAVVEYLRLPNTMTSEDDVKAMKSLKSKNSALKMAGAYKPMTGADYRNGVPDGDYTLSEIALYSFKTNEVSNFRDLMMTSDERLNTKVVRMAGSYGDKDLNNNGLIFNSNEYGAPAIWDFTGANFASCTITAPSLDNYYNYDDPFCENGTVSPSGTYNTNAFYYFNTYTTYTNGTVSIKLPDSQMTTLPVQCLVGLGAENATNYKLVNHLSDSEFTSQFPGQNAGQAAKYAPLEELVIPDCYTDLDYECAKWAHVRHLVIGSGMKRIHGGAFLKCDELEDLDFAAGLSNCYIGDRSFNECKSMKHIALSEGVVSLGNGCFWNSQHLESIRLPQTLINMGNHCFDNCLALNSITIPENVEKIGQCAFKLCPFTDIYLTTTDPAKIPYVWSAGTKFEGSFDGNCTFHHGHIDGWEGGVDRYESEINNVMTWDEAASFYYVNWNGMPVLHFPSQLAEKVRSSISSQYAMKTKADENGVQYGLPLRVDMTKRDNIPGADLGTAGTGKYTQDGWAQFMLMKEMAAGPGSEIYQKEYDDVWYTMCFPFDLSDEQLAGAFNETFNIVDFSGVEIKEPTETTGKKLVLHFNNVAITHYKDTEGNLYDRKTDNSGKVIREKDTDGFEYNVYIRNGQEYHHAIVSSHLSSNKTKTFAPGSACLNLTGQNADKSGVVIIDGILAEAGHPYMIHPAIGFNDGGNNKKNCYFSGIEWLPQSKWAETFEARKRTVDLGVRMGTIDETDYHKSTPDANNYVQAAYDGYAGQTYTFVGNAIEYRAEAGDNIPDEPQVPEKPVKPVKPTAEEVEALKPSQTLVAPSPVVQDPDNNSKYTDEFKELFNAVRCHVYLGYIDGKNRYKDFTYGEDLISYESTDFLSFHSKTWDGDTEYYEFKNRSDQHNENIQNLDIFKTYLGGNNTVADLTGFNALKQLATDYVADQAAYATYKEQFDAYIANRAAWTIYNAKKAEMDNWNQDAVDAQYAADLNDYNDAVAAHDTWVENAKKWMTYIPKGSYFLGRRTNAYPRYYRETAENPVAGQASTRPGGVWTQFTAIVTPNDAALNGIEKELDKTTAQSKGFDMAFNEGFLGDYIDEDDPGIVTAIEEAKKAGAEVEYMDIVVSINGQVVRRGSTSIEGLPKGLYIINGKKYFVK